MRWLIAIILAVPAYAQNGAATFPGGGGGVGVGAANVTATCAGTVTTCPVTITTLALTSATQNTAIVDCYVSSTGAKLSITALAFTGGPPLTTATPTFTSTTGVYCTVNSNGGAGATGPSGPTYTATAPVVVTGTVISADTTVVARKFFGTAAPTSVSGNLPGDFFTDTTAHNQYVCNAPSGTAAPACTSVTAAGWLLVNGGSSAGCTATGTNAIQKNNGSGGCAASSATDDGTTFTITEPLVLGSGPAVTGSGIIGITESTGQACASAADCLIADSSSHRLKVSNNNGTAAQVVQSGVDINTSDQVTATHLASALPVLQGGTGVTTSTGTGAVVLGTGPTITLPNATGLPLTTGVTGTLPVANGGTGVTASQGNGTKNQLSSGTTTTNDCVKFDANGNTVDAGAACGAGGGATIASTTSAIKGDGAGNGVAVTGTGSNCVHVDGSSAACSGSATDINAIRDAVYVQGTGTNSITGTTTTTFASYSAGQTIRLCMAAAANTTATQININSIGNVAITKNGGTALSGGELAASQCYLMTYRTATPSFDMTVSTGGSTSVTTKGDLQGFDTAANRIPVGSNGTILTADSTQALGVKWAAAGASSNTAAFDTTGDQLCANTGGTPSCVGTNIGLTETGFSHMLALATNIPATNKAIRWTIGMDQNSTNSPTFQYKLRACLAANMSAGICSSGSVVLWTSLSTATATTVSTAVSATYSFLFQGCGSGCLMTNLIVNSGSLKGGATTSNPSQTTSITPMSSGSWVIYLTVTYGAATAGNWAAVTQSIQEFIN